MKLVVFVIIFIFFIHRVFLLDFLGLLLGWSIAVGARSLLSGQEVSRALLVLVRVAGSSGVLLPKVVKADLLELGFSFLPVFEGALAAVAARLAADKDGVLHRPAEVADFGGGALGRLLLAQRLLRLEAAGHKAGASSIKVSAEVCDGLVLRLKLAVFSALGAVHHTFNVENICELFVRV